jgi:hypothetical protein
MKKIILALLCCFFLNFNAWASMVSIYVVETGLPFERAETRHPSLWENAFMDVFFDAGYIVSNAPVYRLEERPRGDILEEVEFDLSIAHMAGIDFLIVAQLNFTENIQTPDDILFHVYRVSPREKIAERRFPGRTYRSEREEFDAFKVIARGLIPYITRQGTR